MIRVAAFLFLFLISIGAVAQTIVPAGKPELLKLSPEEYPALPPALIVPKNLVTEPRYTNITRAGTPERFRIQDALTIPLSKPTEIKPIAKHFFSEPTSITPSNEWKYKPEFVHNISNLDIDQGLASSNTNCLATDRQGRVWVTSSGLGLDVFDGKNHFNYTNANSPINNYCNSVVMDKNGDMWVADGYGITRCSGKKFSRYAIKEFCDGKLTGLTSDNQQNLWITFTNGNIIRYDGDKFLRYSTGTSISLDYSAPFNDSKGNYWLRTDKSILKMILAPDGSAQINLYNDPQLSSNRQIRSFAEDKKGNLWIASSNGLLRLNGQEVELFTTSHGLTGNDVNTLFADSKGILWMGTNKGGVTVYNGSYFEHFGGEEGLSDRNIAMFMEDNKGNIWVTCFGEGLYRINSIPFFNLSQKQNISTSAIISIYPDTGNVLWVGTNGGKLFRMDSENQTVLTPAGGFPGGQARSIYKDSKGNLWFGYWGGGTVKYDGKNYYLYSKDQGLPADAILAITEDPRGNMWFGTNSGGVVCFTGDKFLHYTKKTGLPNNSSWGLRRDKKGNIWIGLTHGGAVKYDGKDFYHYSTKQGMVSDAVQVVFDDSKGNYWFGTNGHGADYYDGKTFRHFNSSDGLCNDKVWGIIEDKKGRIWFTTERGISRGYWKGEEFVIDNFDRRDGVHCLDYYNNSIAMDEKGNMYFGGGKGVLRYNTSKEPSAFPNPMVKISDVLLGSQQVKWAQPRFVKDFGDTLWMKNDSFMMATKLPANVYANKGIDYSDVTGFYHLPINLVLPYNEDHITFSFAGTDWGDEHKLRYSFFLSGLETTWSPLTNRSEADYRNLPNGNYTFKVKAVSRQGAESEVVEFSFSILPPWWKTWWFYLLEVLALITLIYFFVRYRERALQESNRKLEMTVNERTAEVVKQKSIVEHKNKDITDSINYARRIQNAILVPLNVIREQLPESFILYKPKDIVSGDFYFYAESAGKVIIAAVDCTGHGVPGAFMSMIGNEVLDQMVNQQKQTDTSDILSGLHRTILLSLNRDANVEKSKDGMDVAILSIDKEKREVQFSGAARPLYYFNSKGFHEVKGERWSIGGVKDKDSAFLSTTIRLEEPSTFYIFSDGFADQFGSDDGKKLMTKNFKKMIAEAQQHPVTEQGKFLYQKLSAWQGQHEQVDDILVIGVRV